MRRQTLTFGKYPFMPLHNSGSYRSLRAFGGADPCASLGCRG